MLAGAIATPADAQLLARKDLSLATALTIATTAVETCKTNGYAVSVAVVGRNGDDFEVRFDAEERPDAFPHDEIVVGEQHGDGSPRHGHH